MRDTARFFLCERCKKQVLICTGCDRGQVYCADDCASFARRQSQREAGRRYQSSLQGRLMHAERSQRFRARRKSVTHQGSLGVPPDAVLTACAASVALAVETREVVEEADASHPPSPTIAARPAAASWHCRFCGRSIAQQVRLGPLRRRPPRTIQRWRVGAIVTRTPELQASILRYYHVEKWRVGTIARQLHVHHGTVRRVLAQAGLPPLDPVARPSQIDEYG